MQRRIKPRFLIIILLLGFVPILIYLAVPSIIPVMSPPGLTYIDSSHPFYPFVRFLSNCDIIEDPENTFVPNHFISRVEAAGMLVRAQEIEGFLQGHSTASCQGLECMEVAATSGIIDDDPIRFRPDDNLTRAEAAVWMLRFAGEIYPPDSVFPGNIRDVGEAHRARGEIAAVLDVGIMTQVEPGSFSPDEPVTRADFARALAVSLVLSPRYLQVPLGGELVPLQGDVYLSASGRSSGIINANVPVGIGDTVRTGAGGRAEVRFSDGSGILLMQDTTVTLRNMAGQLTILKNGDAGTIVDLLDIELPRGKIFGALAAGYIFDNYSPDIPDYEGDIPWWKMPFIKKQRAQVNMPWGVAGVRGTFWMNEVTEEANITNVLHGEVQVTSTGGSVLVLTGDSTVISFPGAPPTQPLPMTDEERQAWVEVEEWVRARCQAMEENAPLVTPRYLASEEDTAIGITDVVELSLAALQKELADSVGASASARVSFSVLPVWGARFFFMEEAYDEYGYLRATYVELPY